MIDPRTLRIVGHFAVGGLPQHVVPAWDLRRLYVTNDTGNSLTPIDPRTGKPGARIPVEDPYNMYFSPDGRYAIVVAERLHRLDFRDPHTFALRHSLAVPCRGVDHMDFSADGRFLVASCEFSGQMVVVSVRRQRVLRTIDLPDGPSGMPQDVKLSPDGRIFYVADMHANGVWEIDARRFRVRGFLRTGAGTHGLYPSRDAKLLYVSNRSAGTVSVVSFRQTPRRRDVADPRWQPRHGRRLRRRQGSLAVRPLRRRGLRDLDTHRTAARAHRRRLGAARPLRLAAAGALLARPHRRPPLRRPDAHRGRAATRAGSASLPDAARALRRL